MASTILLSIHGRGTCSRLASSRPRSRGTLMPGISPCSIPLSASSRIYAVFSTPNPEAYLDLLLINRRGLRLLACELDGATDQRVSLQEYVTIILDGCISLQYSKYIPITFFRDQVYFLSGNRRLYRR